MTTLAVSSEAAIGATVTHHLNLYKAVSNHEKRLLRCVRDLAKVVATGEGLQFDEEFWLTFHDFVNATANKALVTGYANAFVSNYLYEKGANASAGHTLGLYLGVWRRWGIHVSDTAKEKIVTFRREVCKPKDLSRYNIMRNDKAKQYESVEPIWSTMVDYMLKISPEQFREHLRSVVNSRGQHQGIAESSFQEMTTVANKSDGGLASVMRCTLAYASLLRSTGMRSITGLDLKLSDFEELNDGEVILTRTEHKVGSVRNAAKTVYAKIVPAKDAAQCCLVHMANYFVGQERLPAQPFTLGFPLKAGKCRLDFSKPVQTRFIAVLHAIAIASGLPHGLSGPKKLHLFRVMCENVLATRGATPVDREAFIGWTNSTQSNNYSVLKLKAQQSACPYLLAGRDDKDDPPHPMWELFSEANGVDYWQRVYYLAVAAKMITNSAVVIDEDFQQQMDDHLKAAAKHRATTTNPVALNKRIRQLQRELQQERTKRAKVGLSASSDSETSTASDDLSTTSTVDPQTALKEMVATLKVDRKTTNFPSKCLAALPRLTSLIDAASTPQRSFGLALSSSEGKDLLRILYLASLAKRYPETDKGKARSWFGFVDKQRKDHPVLTTVDMRTWQRYRSTI